jgi:RNA recognition motif-containing protein
MEGNRSEERRLGSGIEQSPANGDTADLGDTILFVGGLAKSCTDDELREPFLKFGDVLSARVQRSKSTSKPLGYGFVQMASLEQAEKAKEAMNKALIGGHKVDINWAGRNRVLLVSNLAPSVSREEVLELFSRFGDIEKEKSVEGECSKLI